ncbi:DUF2783 domain-containing protein [Photobacterium minamisatsumaniensis]|uniref:DUF2783 domain-containing protein n=1 Tax=Photobacterium minamisatsumaniensis TaxID=2910233 RepID=UPI003D121DD9
MTTLNTNNQLVLTPNLEDTDGFYNRLIDLHRHGDEQLSQKINARLILTLANHIGNNDILQQALNIAAPAKENNNA